MSEWKQHIHDDRTDEWGTPPSIWRPLSDAIGGFDLDPCSGAETSPIASARYDDTDDGLTEPWFGKVWLNPPYSDMEPWARKCVGETTSRRADTVVALIPSRTSADWWQNNVAKATALCFVDHRIEFQGRTGGDNRDGSGSASFSNAIAVFGECPPDLLDALDRQGMVFDRSERYERTQQVTLEYEETDSEVKADE